MYTCYYCAKTIKGKITHYNPPMLAVTLGVNFPKAFHPKCFLKEEDKAYAELRRMDGNAFNATA